MGKLTITEALAEIKTIGKRLDKKRGLVFSFLGRDERIRDPFSKEGGSQQVVAAEMQSIHDLEERLVSIRTKIQEANGRISITLQNETRTILQWLAWRKEVAPDLQQFYTKLASQLQQLRKEAQAKGMVVMGANVRVGEGQQVVQILVNLDEKKLMEDGEKLESILGELDGQLSLKNATEFVEV